MQAADVMVSNVPTAPWICGALSTRTRRERRRALPQSSRPGSALLWTTSSFNPPPPAHGKHSRTCGNAKNDGCAEEICGEGELGKVVTVAARRGRAARCARNGGCGVLLSARRIGVGTRRNRSAVFVDCSQYDVLNLGGKSDGQKPIDAVFHEFPNSERKKDFRNRQPQDCGSNERSQPQSCGCDDARSDCGERGCSARSDRAYDGETSNQARSHCKR